MALVYIVGVAGSGKSTVQAELQSLGFSVFDEDDSEIGSAHNKASGAAVPVPPADVRTPAWFDEHEWRVRASALQRLRLQALTQIVVLCGNSLTDKEIEEFVDTKIYLHIDEPTLLHRLAARTDNDYGKSDHERSEILARKTSMDQRFAGSAAIIDATRSIDHVVADVTGVIELNRGC